MSNDYSSSSSNTVLHTGVLEVYGNSATVSGMRKNSWSSVNGTRNITVSGQEMWVGQIVGYKEI